MSKDWVEKKHNSLFPVSQFSSLLYVTVCFYSVKNQNKGSEESNSNIIWARGQSGGAVVRFLPCI